MILVNREKNGSFLVKNYPRRKSFVKTLFWRILFIVFLGLAGLFLQYLAGYYPGSGEGIHYVAIPLLFGLWVTLSVRKMDEWDRAVVLRLGKFHRVKGPGLFVMIPFADQISQIVDLRIRVSDFTAETTLTRDSVTVTVDALCFWLVWDAEKAVCEVQNYEEAVILSSKTALRGAISSHDLSTFLEKNEMIEEYLRSTVDRKTTEWGITIQHIEITDIQVPEHLQDSLSRTAQAEREKKGRILIAEAEIEIAAKLEEAAKIYERDKTALNLKNLTILNEGLKAGNSMMLVPNSITEKLEGNGIFGLQALNEIKADRKKGEKTRNSGADGTGREFGAGDDGTDGAEGESCR